MIGGIFAGSLVLGVCVPLFLATQRQADLSAAQARITLQARELSSHFREDVRQASAAEVREEGRLLRLVLARPEQPNLPVQVTYRSTAGGLVREVHAAPHAALTERRLTERRVYDRAAADCRFRREGSKLTAQLDFARELYGRSLRYHLECEATPRSSL
jgi:hypothetical protein